MRRSRFILIAVVIWLSILSSAFIFVVFSNYPKSSRQGCILWNSIEYCEFQYTTICVRDSFTCFLAYLVQLIISLFWLFIFSGVVFVGLRIFIWSNEAQYRDAAFNYHLSTRRAIDSNLVENRFKINHQAIV